MDGTTKLWNDLRALDVGDTIKRVGVRFADRVFLVPFIDSVYRVDPGQNTVEPVVEAKSAMPAVSNELELCLLSFLVFGEIRPRENSWITEKELPGGSIFFQGPHAMPVQPLLDTFGRNAGSFVLRGVSLGGTQAEYGDGSIELGVLPGIRICFAIWEADEEFDASCTVMFDASFKGLFALDVVLALTSSVVSKIVVS